MEDCPKQAIANLLQAICYMVVIRDQQEGVGSLHAARDRVRQGARVEVRRPVPLTQQDPLWLQACDLHSIAENLATSSPLDQILSVLSYMTGLPSSIIPMLSAQPAVKQLLHDYTTPAFLQLCCQQGEAAAVSKLHDSGETPVHLTFTSCLNCKFDLRCLALHHNEKCNDG